MTHPEVKASAGAQPARDAAAPPAAPTRARRTWVVAAVGILALVGKVAGFGRELLVAKLYGASGEIDALLLAMTPGWAIMVIAGDSLRYSVIPELSAAEDAQGLVGFWRRAREILADVAWFGLAISLVLGLGARAWVGLLAGAAPPETRALAMRLAPILAPAVFATLTGTVLASVHNARFHLVRTAAAELMIYALAVIVLLLFAATGGIAAAAWGWTAGYVAFMLLLALPFLGRRVPRRRIAAQRPTWVRAALPVVVASATIPVMNVIDRAVASGLPEGSIAALNYAFKVVLLPISIVMGAIGTVSFPELAKRFAGGDSAGAAARLRGDLAVYIAIVAPVVALFAVLALPLTQVLFERGAFGRDAALLTASCLRGYAGSTAFYGVVLLFIRGAMAGRWLRIPLIGAVVGIALNVVLDVALAWLLGAPGIGLAFTISSGVNAAVTGALLLRRLPDAIPGAGLVARVLAATALAAAAAALIPVTSSSPLFELVLRGTAAAVVLGLVYQVLGVFRACALAWSGHGPARSAPS
jgi:putative peptidoglycan lipid II flippase